jgi:hypothetical protein
VSIVINTIPVIHKIKRTVGKMAGDRQMTEIEKSVNRLLPEAADSYALPGRATFVWEKSGPRRFLEKFHSLVPVCKNCRKGTARTNRNRNHK